MDQLSSKEGRHYRGRSSVIALGLFLVSEELSEAMLMRFQDGSSWREKKQLDSTGSSQFLGDSTRSQELNACQSTLSKMG